MYSFHLFALGAPLPELFKVSFGEFDSDMGCQEPDTRIWTKRGFLFVELRTSGECRCTRLVGGVRLAAAPESWPGGTSVIWSS